jgi:hypothetical protein
VNEIEFISFWKMKPFTFVFKSKIEHFEITEELQQLEVQRESSLTFNQSKQSIQLSLKITWKPKNQVLGFEI